MYRRSMTDKCFERCVKKPGPVLTGSEQSCIAKSMDRYMDVMNVVFRAIARKAQQQQG